VSMKFANMNPVFLVMTLDFGCIGQCFGNPYCLNLQDEVITVDDNYSKSSQFGENVKFATNVIESPL